MKPRLPVSLLGIALSAALAAGCGSGASSPIDAATSQISRANDQAAAISLNAAAAMMEQGRATSGSYVGVSPGDPAVRVVRAGASADCLAAVASRGTLHLAGPGGTVAAGSC